MNTKKIELIQKLVRNEIEDLNTFKKVQFAINKREDRVTRVSYESFKISNFLNDNNFTQEMKLYYLKELKKGIIKDKIEIYDNLPFSTPNVTKEFLRWVDEVIIRIEMNNIDDFNPHPDVFEDVTYFNCFRQYVGKHIIEFYVDYSYLYQRMKLEGFIRKISHKDFNNWLYKNDYISEIIYNKIDVKGFFRSLSKSYSTARENNFNNIFL